MLEKVIRGCEKRGLGNLYDEKGHPGFFFQIGKNHFPDIPLESRKIFQYKSATMQYPNTVQQYTKYTENILTSFYMFIVHT